MDHAWNKGGSDNPGAWLIQPDGMVDYNDWLDTKTKQEPGYGMDLEDLAAPHADAQELMQDVEGNSQLGMGSLEFAGDLSHNEPNLSYLPYSTSTLPSTAQTTHATTPAASTSSSASPHDFHSCGSSPPNSATPNATAKHHLVVLGIPQEGTRTRVETQINVTFALLQAKAGETEEVLPEDLITTEGDLSEIARQRCRLVTNWSYLKLPAFAAIKRKHKKYIKTDATGANTIDLDVKIVKSDSDEQVLICNSCQERERKRAQRKKDPKAKNEAEIEEDDGEVIAQNDRRRIILFNCGQHIDFSDGQASFPARIACYCRHHKEKDGFRILCSIRDGAGQVLAATVSRPVFTTDDHKARPRTSDVARNVTSENLQALAQEQKDPRPQRSMGARKDSTAATVAQGPVAGPSKLEEPSPNGVLLGKVNGIKVRQSRVEKPYDASQRPRRQQQNGSLNRSTSSLSMTPLDTPLPSPHPSTQTSPATTPHGGAWGSDMHTLPWPPASAHFEGGYVSMADLHQPFNSGHRSNPHSDSGTSPGATGDSASMHSSVTSQEIHDMIVDASPDCVPADMPPLSPSQALSRFPLAQTMPEINAGDSATDLPKMDRIVPDRGPLSGGTEVTILGANLRRGLVVLFGGTPGYATEIWSSNAMVVTVPPGSSPGPVFLAFKDHMQNLEAGIKSYVYVDDMDRRIMEMALQVVGISMNGRQEDATEVARRIVNRTSSRQGSPAEAWAGSEFLNSAALRQSPASYSTDFEGSILKLLSILDRPLADGTPGSRASLREPLGLRNESRHGLLHMAAMLGFHRLTFWCLTRGGDPNITDKYGFTPLHFAALHGRVTVTRLLLQAGARTYQRSMLGRTALEMAIERDQPDIASLFPVSRPTRPNTSNRRSQSGFQSRRSSRSSLFSFFTENGDDSNDSDDDKDYGPGRRLSDRACEADASDEEDEQGSDLESRLSRTPSAVSLPLQPTDIKSNASEGATQTLPEKESAAKQGLHVGDIAGAYHGFLSKLSSKMPQTPQLAQTYSLSAYAPHWADKLSVPPHLVNVEQMKAWFHARSTSSPATPTAATDSAAPNLATFNPPVGHFWRPFDVLRRSSFSTQQPQPPQPEDASSPEHVYPPPQTEVEMPSSPETRDSLARRLGYIPQDINANVLRAVDYHRTKYSALRRRRVFFVFILPAILLALAWLFYGANSLSLGAILRPSSFLSSYASQKHVLPLAF